MLIDDKKAALSTLTGMTSSIPDMELKWLRTSTGSSEFSIPQLWYIYLTTLGYSGSIPDMKAKYFQSLGYSGALPEMEAAFWAAGGAPSWGATMDRWWDFTRNISGVPTTITDTHPQAILADNVAGSYSSFAVDTLVRTDKGMQTRPTRTNSLRNNSMGGAAAGTPGTLPTNWSLYNPASLTQTVVGTGTEFGLPYIDLRYQGTAASSVLQVAAETNAQIVAASGETWTNSVFFRLVGGSITGFSGVAATINENTAAGAYVTGAVGSTIAATSDLQRATYTRTLNGGGTVARVQQVISLVVVNGVAVDFTVRLYAPQLELGSFASPPILTSGSALTVNGNLQSIDLTGKLATGVRGIIRVNIRQPTVSGTNPRVFEMNDGTGSNYVTLFRRNSTGNFALDVTVGGVNQATVDTGVTFAAGSFTFAFAATAGFSNVRAVGGALPSAGSPASYPSMSKGNIGGTGYNTGSNTFENALQLALGFGAQDATTFADAYAKAQILAALP